jgi:hypothetical protein
MNTQPTIHDLILQMAIPSGPEATCVPQDRTQNLPRQGFVGSSFSTPVGQQHRDDWPGPAAENIHAKMQMLFERLDRIETLLERLVQQRTVKDWYTIAEAAEILGKADFTVREWCRLGRIHAQKRPCGRGRSREWMISHAELLRIQNEGLLPQETISTRIR